MRSTQNNKRSPLTSEKGIYLILTAVLAIALIGFCGLAVGLAFVATNEARLQVVANLIGYAILPEYIDYTYPPESPPPNLESARRAAAIARGEAVLIKNRLPGTAASLGGIQDGTGGEVDFGEWIKEPTQGTCPGDKYPCFDEVSPSEKANAVRVVLRTKSDNPITGFFTSIFGRKDFSLQADATVAYVDRCTAYLLDLSLSTVDDTNKLGPAFGAPGVETHDEDPTLPPIQSVPPQPLVDFVIDTDGVYTAGEVDPKVGLFALQRRSVFGSTAPNGTGGTVRFCHVFEDYLQGGIAINEEFMYWCALDEFLGPPAIFPDPPIQTRAEAMGLGLFIPPGAHFQSDYGADMQGLATPFGQMLIDRYNRPEPLSTFYLGFNAGLRAVRAAQSTEDKALFMAFTNDSILHPYNPDGTYSGVPYDRRYPPTGLTNNLGFLIQLTNLDNIGRVDEQGMPLADPPLLEPNFVSKGWFPFLMHDPLGEATGTHLGKALWKALNELSMNCTDSSRKSIIVATDGIPTCKFDYVYASEGEPFLIDIGSIGSCGSNYSYFMDARTQIYNYILPELKERKISLYSLFAGQFVKPNYKNIHNPSSDLTEAECADPANDGSTECFLDFKQAQALGYGGSLQGTYGGIGQGCGINSFFNCDSSVPQEIIDAEGLSTPYQLNQYAYEHLGDPGIKFGLAIGLMGELTFKSGGLLCPILPPATPDQYIDHDNDTGGACEENPCLSGTHSCCPSNCTPCRLRNSVRTGEFETVALEYLTPGAQAAKCVKDALGSFPYVSVEEDY